MPRRAALLALALLAACARPGRVRPGDRVTLRYELSARGAVVESRLAGDPIVVVQGAGDLPAGADEALLGMAAGEEKTVALAPEKAFGPRDPKRVETTPLADFGDLARTLKPGGKVLGLRDGKPESARVVAVAGGRATLDFNHPLAGETVVYRLRVESISPRE